MEKFGILIFAAISWIMLTDSGSQLFNQYVLSLMPALQNFRYSIEAPLMHWTHPIMFCTTYLVTILSLRYFMQNQKSWDMKAFRIFHNAFLCFGSFAMVVGMGMGLKASIEHSKESAVEVLFCDSMHNQTYGNLFTWYYIFYLSKYYEFIDTIILILRKKPITFLHSFHHFITAWLCWLGLYDRIAVQWSFLMLNGTVHVFMYYYYLAVSLNKDVWWKKYITTMQIVQFILDLSLGLPFYYNKLVLNKNCMGEVSVLATSNLVLTSFLILFINFFQHAYKKGATKSD